MAIAGDAERARGRDGACREAVWVEYPIGWWGELLAAVRRTLLSMLAGVGAAAALVLAFGLLGEERVLPSRDLTRAVDMFTRFSMAPLGAGAFFGWFALTLVQLAHEVAVSRALARWARGDANRNAVPEPGQLALATTPPGRRYSQLVVMQAMVLGLLLVIGGVVILLDPFEGAWLVIGVPALWLALLLLGVAVLNRWVRPAQARRAKAIEECWTTGRQTAARAGAKAQDPVLGEETDQRLRLGNGLLGLTAAFGGIAVLLMYAILFVTHPDAEHWPGGRAGDRATLPPAVEALIDQLTLAFALLVVSAVVAALAGTTLVVVAQRDERRFLTEALGDPDSPRPMESTLRRQLNPFATPSVKVLAGLSGGGLGLAITGIGLSGPGPEEFASVYRGSAQLFGPLLPVFEWTLLGSVALLGAAIGLAVHTSVRGRGLRNALRARWPVSPK